MTLLLIPVVAAFLASAWLWGPVWGEQRQVASGKRRLTVLIAAILVTLVIPALFAIQAFIPLIIGVWIVAACILTVVGLLYALLPPQKEL
jgi:hypothetical protein